MFTASELSLVILHLMEAQPRHGYDLIREFENSTGGTYAPSPGIVYPTLTMLEESGEIEAMASEGVKRLFRITAVGRARLVEQADEINAALARLVTLRTAGSQIDAGPVSRAMRNLTAVLEQRAIGPLDKQSLFDIADLIDEVARKIERLQ